MAAESPRELKRRLSSRLLAIRGVSGVGIPGGRLTVYLEEDSEAVRKNVETVLATEGGGAPVAFVVTGALRPH